MIIKIIKYLYELFSKKRNSLIWYPFKEEVFLKSSTANRHGILNDYRLHRPNALNSYDIYSNLFNLQKNIVAPVYDEFCKFTNKTMAINSGYRCLELNKLLKSKDTSQHVRGQAVDFEVYGVSNFKVFDWIRRNLDFDQLILEHHRMGETNSGWVHCSFNKKGSNRKNAFVIDE